MPRQELPLRHLFSVLFCIYLGSFYFRIQQAFWPNVPRRFLFAFVIVSLLTVWLTSIKLKPLRFFFLTLSLPVFATIFTSPEALPVGQALPIYLVYLSFDLFTISILDYLKRYASIWLPLTVTTVAQMILFSYFKRSWDQWIPLHFASALLLQYHLRLFVSRSPASHPSENSSAFSSSAHPKTLFSSQSTWVHIAIVFSLTLGLLIPPFKAVWFQQGVIPHSILSGNNQGYALSSAKPLNRTTMFSWKLYHLGDPIQQDFTPLFYVQSKEPMYWRSLSFDSFIGTGDSDWTWTNTSPYEWIQTTFPIRFSPESPRSYDHVSADVQSLSPIAPGVGLLLPPLSLEVLSSDPLTGLDTCQTSSTIINTDLIPFNLSYHVDVAAPRYSIEDLRKVKSLPKSVPGYEPKLHYLHEKFGQLAHDITATAQTPYDKIMALIDYLHHETYTLTPPPPSSKNIVYDFLFYTHQGYCVHFSSALAVLAQSLGYPARWVVGFNEGKTLPDDAENPFPSEPRDQVRILSQANAHSWVEIYFPDYGWVPFEATPGFSYPLQPPETNSITPTISTELNTAASQRKLNDIEKDDTAGSAQPNRGFSWVIALFIGGIFSLTILRLTLLYIRRQRTLKNPTRVNMQKKYLDWIRKLSRIGSPRHAHETPLEFLAHMMNSHQEWNTHWKEFTKLANDAFYAPSVTPRQLEEMNLHSLELHRIYRHLFPLRTRCSMHFRSLITHFKK